MHRRKHRARCNIVSGGQRIHPVRSLVGFSREACWRVVSTVRASGTCGVNGQGAEEKMAAVEMISGVMCVSDKDDDVPVDEDRTNRSHVGEAITDGRNYPGYLLIGLGLAALGFTLVAAGYGFRGWAVIAGSVCALSFAVGILVVLAERRRIKRLEGEDLFDQEGH